MNTEVQCDGKNTSQTLTKVTAHQNVISNYSFKKKGNMIMFKISYVSY